MSRVAPRIVATSGIVPVDVLASITFPVPAGTATGDYLVAVVRGQNYRTAAQELTAAGWSRISDAPEEQPQSQRTFGIYGHAVTDIAAEPSSHTLRSTRTDGRGIGILYVVRGVDLSNPIAGRTPGYMGATPGYVVGGAGQTGTASIAEWDVADVSLAILGTGIEFSAKADVFPTSTPAGYPELHRGATSASSTVSRTVLWTGAGEYGPGKAPAGAVVWPNSNSFAIQAVALRGMEEAAPIDPRGEGREAFVGDGSPARVFYSTSSGEVRTPAALVPFLAGFDSVEHMLATPGFTWGHRGNSVRYPEMSRQAYAQTAARGYGVLEFSMARTSDGVWFGCHDGTLDRVVGSAVGDPATMTWAQVQALSNVSGQTGKAQPFYRWEDFLADFGDTHVLVLDPKHAMGTYRQEFVDLVERDCDPARVILKYFGVGSGAAWLADAARARGMASWGYFYQADAEDGDLVQWANRWSLIGMDHSANQAAWDVALSTGIPVIGHIARSQAEYDAAMSKGAVGVQVGATHIVRAVGPYTS